jgi:hypothetical protein
MALHVRMIPSNSFRTINAVGGLTTYPKRRKSNTITQISIFDTICTYLYNLNISSMTDVRSAHGSSSANAASKYDTKATEHHDVR